MGYLSVQQTKSHQREFYGFSDRDDLCEPSLHLASISEAFGFVDRNTVDVVSAEYDSSVDVVSDDQFQHLLNFDSGHVDLLGSVSGSAPVVEHDGLPAWPSLAADCCEFPAFENSGRELRVERAFYHNSEDAEQVGGWNGEEVC